MPSKSIAQQHLMQAAEHGADFPMAKKVRSSMTHNQLHDFSVGSEANKPEHVDKADPPPTFKGSHHSIINQNTKSHISQGKSELDATRAAIRSAGPEARPKSRHKNLGKFLHPRKDGKPHGNLSPDSDGDWDGDE